MISKPNSRLSYIFVVIFLVAGLLWVSVALLNQGDLLLVLPGFVSLISAGLILIKPNLLITRNLALSAGVYNLIIFVYQSYSAFSLIGSNSSMFFSIAAIGYLFGTGIFLFLVLRVNGDSKVFSLS
ncbi:hypothetical protein ACFL96_18085 [Thermoproteota archaeon]